jgi:hypothetical protein
MLQNHKMCEITFVKSKLGGHENRINCFINPLKLVTLLWVNAEKKPT